MDYKGSLLNLIRGKKEINDRPDGLVAISVNDIAEAWNKQNVWRTAPVGAPIYDLSKFEFVDQKFLDPDFLENIFLVIKKLEDEKFIKFKDTEFQLPFGKYRKEKLRNPQDPSIFDIQLLAGIYDKILLEVLGNFDKNIELKGKNIEFIEPTHSIVVDGIECTLPYYRNEHYLARVMFSRLVGESVDWSEVYNEMTGFKDIAGAKEERSVRDAMYALNKRIRKFYNTSDDLLSWDDKSIKRNF